MIHHTTRILTINHQTTPYFFTILLFFYYIILRSSAFIIFSQMFQYNKHNNPSDLGPWIPSQITKYIPEQSSAIEPNDTQKTKDLNRLTIRLPRIGQNFDNTSRSKKLALKMSHQSLELSPPLKQAVSSQNRYGKMNGSVLHFYGQNRKERKTQMLQLQLEGELTRKVSTILVQPLQTEDLNKRIIEKGHCLLNAESSKKRSLYTLINELRSNKQLTKIFLAQRRHF